MKISIPTRKIFDKEFFYIYSVKSYEINNKELEPEIHFFYKDEEKAEKMAENLNTINSDKNTKFYVSKERVYC